METNYTSNNAWDYLLKKTENVYAASALLGGILSISKCNPCDGFSDYQGFLSIEDESFRRAFVFDKKPFGIWGWMTWHRKQSLLNYAKANGKDICDLFLQLDFMMDEFTGTTYGGIWNKLIHAETLDEAKEALFSGYFDNVTEMDKEILSKSADNVYNEYVESKKEAMIAVKYVTTDLKKTTVLSKRTNRFPFFRKKLGVLKRKEIYPFIVITDDGNELVIDYNGQFGYVRADKNYVVTRLESANFAS